MVIEDIEYNNKNKKKGIKNFGYSEELNKTLNFPGKKINVQAGNDVSQSGLLMDLDEIGDEGVKILAKEWKGKLKPGMEINLNDNKIGIEGAKILAEEWKDRVKPIDIDKLTDTEKEALRRYWKRGISEEGFRDDSLKLIDIDKLTDTEKEALRRYWNWNRSVPEELFRDDSLKPIDIDKLTDTEKEALRRYWKRGISEEGFRDDIVENHTIKHDENQEGLLNKLKNVGGDIIDMKLNGIGDDGLIQLVEQLRDKLSPGIKIILSDNNITLKGIKVFTKELKDNLQRGMEIDFGYNQIGAQGVKEMSKEWSTALKKGMILKLGQNNIGDAGAEAISKMELKEGVILDLSRNDIGDVGVDAIMKNFELKKGVTINLRFNNISLEKRKELEKRVKLYNDKGIDCSVLI